MGIEIHTLKFIEYISQKKNLGDCVTLGRQNIYVDGTDAKGKFNSKVNKYIQWGDYCEKLLIHGFGAKTVTSIDKSNYEGATLVYDLNKELPAQIDKYDTVFDIGTLEHVFDIKQAFINCSKLSKKGGQIIHVLPANNACGHGFWQFSPELFFSMYSEENGFLETQVYIVNLRENNYYYEVCRPSNGNRAYVSSDVELYVMVRTVKSAESINLLNINQSDYIYEWGLTDGDREKRDISRLKSIVIRLFKNIKVVRYIYYYIYDRYTSKKWINGTNKNLKKIKY